MKNYKKNIVVGITLFFIITTLFPAFEAQFNNQNITPENNMNNSLLTHTVLAEQVTATWCPYCPSAAYYLNQVYNQGYDFHYVALVCDMNSYANSRRTELGITSYPTVCFDGGYTNVVGGQSSTTNYINAINTCGARTVADIDLSLDAYWLGGGEIQVNVDVTNNGGSSYSGHLHVYVTEKISRWDDYDGDPYLFAMINNFAINQNIDVSSSSTQSYSDTWSGYTDITMSNIKVVATVFAQSSMYVDETTAADPQYPNSDPPTTPSVPTGPSSGYVGIPYTFQTSSTEPNGDQIKYGFDFDGDGDVDHWTDYYPSGSPAEATNSWDSVGTYNIKVKAKDQIGTESGWSSAKTIQISTGDPPNIPSTPSGPDSGMHKISYTYSTSTTDPNDGDQMFYKFDWDDGTTSQWLGPYDSGEPVSTDHAWNDAGTFDIKVKAKDLAGSESGWSNTKTVYMDNTPPNQPSKPSGPTSGSVGVKYTFSTSTSDPENDPLEYFFSWGDGTNSGWTTSKSADHIWVTSGDFGVRVKARDKWDESQWSQSRTISIEAGTLTVNIQVNPENAIVGESIQFSSTVSDGEEPYTYNWDLGDGNTSEEQNFNYQYEQVGTYTVTLSVQDNSNAYGSDYTTVTIEITNPPDKPIINGPESALINQPCDFTFSSDDPNYDNVYFFVDWGDDSESVWEGPYPSENQIDLSHIWENEGVYTVKVKAKDIHDYESEWSDEFQITIGWQEAFIIGKIISKDEKEDTTDIIADSIFYITSDPFGIKRYNSEELIVLSNDYKGILGNKIILGKFQTGYI
jgi:PKD repeat protein/glutaredoxin